MANEARVLLRNLLLLSLMGVSCATTTQAEQTQKPVLHGRHWVAITGKPLAATAGAQIFQQGGNAVDAACAMLAAAATMWDTLSWGGETQALIFDPNQEKVVAINALGAAPSGATPALFKRLGLAEPPGYGPLAAVTPGTPGGLMTMLAEYGTMSLAQVLAPAREMANGYPVEQAMADTLAHDRRILARWEGTRRVFFRSHNGQAHLPQVGEIFRQPDLAATLDKLIEAEHQALAHGAGRKQAIYAAYERFYRGDIGADIARATQAAGGLITRQDLADWQVHIEEPVHTSYHGIDVYKLNSWVQGPVMLETLNILEQFDLKAMRYNSARYIHTLYQAMNLAFADRDFYYGDPYFPPEEPIDGLLSKAYARRRAALIDPDHNDPRIAPGDPYLFQAGDNPFPDLLDKWQKSAPQMPVSDHHDKDVTAGTTSIQAADAQGWVVSITPSGGWLPAFVAGDTGVGLSQRMQSFVLDPAQGPYNVLQPGKRPRATLSPGLALRNGKPYLSFATQGGDLQDQWLLQFFLDVVEFGMTVQQAVEAPSFMSWQMHASFGDHASQPGRLGVNASLPEYIRRQLGSMGYRVELGSLGDPTRTSGPINAIYIDQQHGTLWGGSSNFGDDYGVAW